MEIREWRLIALRSIIFCIVVCASCVFFSNEKTNGTSQLARAQTEAIAETTDPPETEVFSTESIPTKNPVKPYVVVLDAGHGGMDEGTSSRDFAYHEKDIALYLTLQVGKQLERDGRIQVYYTRKEDKAVKKSDRVKLAEHVKADLFLSIHCNATGYGDPDAQGIETLYSMRTPKYGKVTNREFAVEILDALEKSTGRKRRGIVQREGLYLLHHAQVPTIIAEIGYMTSAEEMKYLAGAKGQKDIVRGLTTGVINLLEQ